jgi:hypothetical protein
VLWTTVVVLLALQPQPAPEKLTIRLSRPIDGRSKVTIDVMGLRAATLDELAKSHRQASDWTGLFTVSVANSGKPGLPLLGSYRIEDGILRFEPRFPLALGIAYRAVFEPSRLPSHGAAKPLVADFFEPKAKSEATTLVEQVYPTRDRLPENQLKFYLHFSAPMSKGEAYRHVRLLDARGKPVELPFLELDEELWDPQSKRFTLFFDPGRIKRGLKPREEVGPALEEGKSYTLVIDSQWLDAKGNPLRQSFRKRFSVGPPDDVPPDPKTWKLEAPAGKSTAPLVVHFPKPLDHALLQRMLWVTDAAGKKMVGTIAVSDEETCWRFLPDEPWKAGDYALVMDTALEDLAGNSIGRPFEVDVFRPVQRTVKTETVRLDFRIGTAAPR